MQNCPKPPPEIPVETLAPFEFDYDRHPCLVIDWGSHVTRAGIGGEDRQSFCEKSLIRSVGSRNYIGAESDSKKELKGLLLEKKNSHKEETLTEDIEFTEKYLSFLEEFFGVDGSHCPLFFTEMPEDYKNKKKRQKLCELVFERFETPAFYSLNQSILSLYSSGRTTGLVYSLGESCSHVVPVIEGHTLYQAILSNPVNGKAMTAYYRVLLSKMISTAALDEDLVRDMKEKSCFVPSEGFDKLDGQFEEKFYELPDGRLIPFKTLGAQCTEALFAPSVLGLSDPGCLDLIQNCIKNCEVDLRRDLYQNMLLSGGVTLMSGLADKIFFKGNYYDSKIIAPPERDCSAWIGGSILTTLTAFLPQMVSKADYAFYGCNVINTLGLVY